MTLLLRPISLLLSLIILSPLSLAAPKEALDGIKIIVDKDVISVSQFNQRMQQALAASAATGNTLNEDRLIKEVGDQLIVESLQLQMAKRSGVHISNQQLTEALNDTARRNQLSLAELKLQIEKDGQNYVDFREQMRQQMLIQHVQQGNIRSKVNITDKEIDNYLSSPAGKSITEESYDVSFITYPISSKASPAEIDKGKASLTQLQKQFQQGKASFSDYVSGKMLDGVKISGSNFGKRSAADLPSLFADKVINLNTGDISAPLRSGAGWHLVKMNKKVGGLQEEYQVNSRHILIKPSAVRSNEQAEKLARDLHQRLIDGEDFSLLAKEYSEDPGSALQGGDLGWSSPNRYVPAFIETLSKLKPGETSQPFLSDYGWHIIYKIDERTHDVTQEDQRNQARQHLGQRQYNEALDAWLNTIKSEAFIEYK